MSEKVRWIKECWQSIGKGIKKEKIFASGKSKVSSFAKFWSKIYNNLFLTICQIYRFKCRRE